MLLNIKGQGLRVGPDPALAWGQAEGSPALRASKNGLELAQLLGQCMHYQTRQCVEIKAAGTDRISQNLRTEHWMQAAATAMYILFDLVGL